MEQPVTPAPSTHQAPQFREAVNSRLERLEQGQARTHQLLSQLLEETEPEPTPQNPEPQPSNQNEPQTAPGNPEALSAPPVPSPQLEEELLQAEEVRQAEEAEAERRQAEINAARKKNNAGRWI